MMIITWVFHCYVLCRNLPLSYDVNSSGTKMNRARSADDILDDSCHDDADDVEVMSPPPKPPLDFSHIPVKLLTLHRLVCRIKAIYVIFIYYCLQIVWFVNNSML